MIRSSGNVMDGEKDLAVATNYSSPLSPNIPVYVEE